MGESHRRSASSATCRGGLLRGAWQGWELSGEDLDSVAHGVSRQPAAAPQTSASARVVELRRVPQDRECSTWAAGFQQPCTLPRRLLGCDVTGIDLSLNSPGWPTPFLGDAVSDRTRFRRPCPKASVRASSFDVVWTIQMQINIQDKRRLYPGIARVLRPGGCSSARKSTRETASRSSFRSHRRTAPTRAIWPMRIPPRVDPRCRSPGAHLARHYRRHRGGAQGQQAKAQASVRAAPAPSSAWNASRAGRTGSRRDEQFRAQVRRRAHGVHPGRIDKPGWWSDPLIPLENSAENQRPARR